MMLRKPSVAVKYIMMMSNLSTVSALQLGHNCFVFYMVRSDCSFLCPLLISMVFLMLERLWNEEERNEKFSRVGADNSYSHNSLCSLRICA